MSLVDRKDFTKVVLENQESRFLGYQLKNLTRDELIYALAVCNRHRDVIFRAASAVNSIQVEIGE